MKPAALEVKKAQTTTIIEANLDALLKASSLEYKETNAPVKKPEFRQFQTLQRINAKLGLYMSTLGTHVAADLPAEASSTDETTEQLPAETETPPVEVPVVEPAKKKSKNK